MPRSLPPNPSVRFLKLEAKNIIKAHKKGDAKCCETLRCHSRFSGAGDEEILKADISLQDAQHALSLDYGYRNWSDLVAQASAVRKRRTDRELPKALEALQASDDPLRQSHAIHTIGLLKIREGLPHIIPLIESPSKYLQWEAVRAVIRLMGDKCRPLVYHLLDSDAPDRAKELVAAHFGRSEKDEKSIDYLTARFETAPEDRYRHGIAYMLLGLRSDLAIPFIRKDIRSGNRPIRYKALTSLRDVDYPERIDDWRWVLENEPVEAIRVKAIQIIGENRVEEMVNPLEQLAWSDGSRKTRDAAAMALDKIHSRSAGRTSAASVAP